MMLHLLLATTQVCKQDGMMRYRVAPSRAVPLHI
jgi:hypothetical protein